MHPPDIKGTIEIPQPEVPKPVPKPEKKPNP